MTWLGSKKKNQNGFCSDLLSDPAAAVRPTRFEPDTPCVGVAKCSAGNREGRDAGPRLVASQLYFLEGTVQSRVPSLRGRVFTNEFCAPIQLACIETLGLALFFKFFAWDKHSLCSPRQLVISLT